MQRNRNGAGVFWLLVAGSLLMACERSSVPTLTPEPTGTPTATATVQATLLLTKLVDKGQALPGEELRYTIVIMNDMMAGDDPGTTVSLVDMLPTDVEFVSGSLSAEAFYDPMKRSIAWSGRVPRGGSMQVGFSARLTQEAATKRSILNQVQVQDAFGRQMEAAAQTHVTVLGPTATPVPLTETATATPPGAAATLTPTPKPTAIPSPTPVQWPEATVPYIKSLVVTPNEPPDYYLVVGDNLYRSTDRGSSWALEVLPGVPAGAGVTCVALDYRHPQTMYLATSEGLYRREGPDQPWGLVNTMRATALTVDLVNSDMLWAGIAWDTATRSVIVKSTDRGLTWSKADYGIPSAWVGAILINPNNPNVIWAHVRPGTRYDWPKGHVFRGGRDGSWERLSLGKPFELVSDPDPFGEQNREACFVSGLAYDPNLNVLYAGCDVSWYNGPSSSYRLLRSLNADSPDSALVHWEVQANLGPAAGLGMNSVRPLAVDAREPKSIFLFLDVTGQAGTPRFRLLVSHDDGQTWQDMAVRGLPES